MPIISDIRLELLNAGHDDIDVQHVTADFYKIIADGTEYLIKTKGEFIDGHLDAEFLT